ncbi:MAG: alpha/beta hydrolase [Myxococcota bacterium]
MDLLDHPLIAARYFFPQSVALPGATLVPTPVGPLACWRSAPPSDRPVLVHFHGNGELVHHWIEGFVPVIQGMGFEVFLAEYRGYGASAGEPLLGSMLGDVDAIREVVGVPDSQIVVFGRSVGSIFAMEWIARFPETRGLIIESGIFDVLERLALRVTPRELGCAPGALEQACSERLDHGQKLASYPGPSLFLHAEGDHLVDISHAERSAAAAGERATLLRLPYGDHNSIMGANTEAYFTAVQAFLNPG